MDKEKSVVAISYLAAIAFLDLVTCAATVAGLVEATSSRESGLVSLRPGLLAAMTFALYQVPALLVVLVLGYGAMKSEISRGWRKAVFVGGTVAALATGANGVIALWALGPA